MKSRQTSANSEIEILRKLISLKVIRNLDKSALILADWLKEPQSKGPVLRERPKKKA